MGFEDALLSDGEVTMKHTEYYSLMREAAKAELLIKAIQAEVPTYYLQAFITGKKANLSGNTK